MSIAAAVVFASSWHDHVAARAARDRATAIDLGPASEPAPSSPAAPSMPPTLPSTRDLPVLLARLEALALDNHLGWAAADYRLRPAGDTDVASMEIRTQFTGAYPQIRRLLSQSLASVPGLTFRQLSFSRANSDTSDVEAKVVFAILLADSPAADGAAPGTAARKDDASWRAP